jgi:ATP-dependent DNA helicase RecG
MEETTDGFRIAEEDLLIRGPGEFMGTKQWGLPDFRVANIALDGQILNRARSDAFAIMAEDVLLNKPEHQGMREELERRWEGRFTLIKTG